MCFEWDERKSRLNRQKHGISFDEAVAIWASEPVMVPARLLGEEIRMIAIGRAKGKVWTAVYTERDGAIRIISVRRARKQEQELYE